MSLENIVLFVVGVSHIIFGLFVLFNNFKKTVNRVFFVFTIGVAIWNLGIALIQSGIASQPWQIIVADRMTYVSVPIMLSMLIIYVRIIVEGSFKEQFKKSHLLKFLMIYNLVTLIIAPTNLVSVNQGSVFMQIGPWYPVFGFSVLLSIVYIIYSAIKGLESVVGQPREKILYFLAGFVFMAMGGLIFNIVLPILGLPSYPGWGSSFAFFMVFFMGLGTLGFYLFGSMLISFGLMLGLLIILSTTLVVVLLTF